MQYSSRLEELERRFEELTSQMADPVLINDSENYRKTAKAQSEMADVVAKYREYKHVKHNLEEGRMMLNESDPDLREMAAQEVLNLEPQLAAIEEELKVMLLPKDPLQRQERGGGNPGRHGR